MATLPTEFVTSEDIEIQAELKAAKHVGGDFYDYFLLDNEHAALVIADVSGKGIPAAMFMMKTITCFKNFTRANKTPAQILREVNASIYDENSQMFVTCFLAILNKKTGELQFANAGHNPPVILPKGEFIEVLPNAPVGLWPGLEYEGESIDNIKGCPLFLYSDGLNEAENRAQKQFGDDHLLHLLSNAEFSSARQTVEEIEEEVEKFRDGAEPNDDLTMMGISIK
jgi:serine phosphatase RsbU (regulator of sigma subunit)